MGVHASRQPESGTVLIWNDDAEHVRLTDADADDLIDLIEGLLYGAEPSTSCEDLCMERCIGACGAFQSGAADDTVTTSDSDEPQEADRG